MPYPTVSRKGEEWREWAILINLKSVLFCLLFIFHSSPLSRADCHYFLPYEALFGLSIDSIQPAPLQWVCSTTHTCNFSLLFFFTFHIPICALASLSSYGHSDAHLFYAKIVRLFALSRKHKRNKFLTFLSTCSLSYIISFIFLGKGVRVMYKIYSRRHHREGRTELFTHFRKVD